ncbi:hypothetical protein NHL50_09445 [Acidimicrobiia bacterium EGI L10123]|uniref:hypothetical protein n=1 Tax=Salinilacustrithrix flava TaxID=2957203 RepID=UPI003D7C14D1|nr:hypothetical protein [Acidimicrobiia bacterium EGI L10123]
MEHEALAAVGVRPQHGRDDHVLSGIQTPNKQHSQWTLDATEGQWTSDAVLAALGFDILDSGVGPVI